MRVVNGLLLPAAAVLATAACGGTAKTTPPTTGGSMTTAPSTTTTTQPAATTTPSALQAEATAAATGDIPDNQVFVLFHDAAAGYSIRYPEGWAQQGNGKEVTFRDKNNIVRVLVASGTAPTPATIKRQLSALGGVRLTSGPAATTIHGAPALKVVYTTASAPNAVTGKRVTLTVDRYYLSHAGTEAIVDLGTPVGVDNVDAYRLMIESFRWR